MNKKIKRAICAISILLCADTYGILHSTKEKIYKEIEKPRIYKYGVTTIDGIAYCASNLATGLIYLTYAAGNIIQTTSLLDLYEKMIDKRITYIEKNIKEDEKSAINAMYLEFNISPEQQHSIETNTNQFKQFEKEYMLQPHEEIVDNLALEGPEILQLLKGCCIHPGAIKKVVSPAPSTENAQRDAASIGLKALVKMNNNGISIHKIINPPRVFLYPSFFQLRDSSKQSILAHELAHLAAQHEATICFILIGISAATGIDTKTIIQSASFKKLITVCERQAEILYKDAQWAKITRQYRSRFYYDDHLFLGHYAQLTEIDELHKLKDKIKNYKTDSCSK